MGVWAVSGALTQDPEEPQAKRLGHEHAPRHETDISEQVEYGVDDYKAMATTRVDIIRCVGTPTGVQEEDGVGGVSEKRVSERDKRRWEVLQEDVKRLRGEPSLKTLG